MAIATIIGVYIAIAFIISLSLLCHRYQRDMIYVWSTLVVAALGSLTVLGVMDVGYSIFEVISVMVYNVVGIYGIALFLLLARGNKEKLDWTQQLLTVAMDIRNANQSLKDTSKAQRDVLADILGSAMEERRTNWYARGVIDGLCDSHSGDVPVGFLGDYNNGRQHAKDKGLDALRNL